MEDPIGSNRKFARTGRSWTALRKDLHRRRTGDLDWNDLRNLKASYNAGEDVADVAWQAYSLFQGDNLLYGNLLYPSLPAMAEEVVGMALELFDAPEGACGTVTSGGTESIILAVKTARDWAQSERPVPGRGEIIVGRTCHAAFNKAAEMLGLHVVRVATDAGFRADPVAVSDAITENTIMIVGSAPAYPIGCLDPIGALAALAREHRLWLHVDACVGGFFLPFARDLGERVPDFDFSLADVTSMSADLHKYGYTSRGASLLLLRDQELSRFQRFSFNDWPSGEFITMTIAGSRPGGAVASAWAVMNYLGHKGYCERVEEILDIRRRLAAMIDALDGIHILGSPVAGIVGLGGDGSFDMAALRDTMAAKGWQFGPLVDPPGINLLLNFRHGAIIDAFAADLAATLEEAKAGTLERSSEPARYGN
ncbi:pyridoxal phosphate-dependent decarboxylase family protein [Pelagibius sp.]|uniref:pyridoxal phosphate-dependent decarboxylase family protein n=1 Tax=Pelagibius sp. TaxID=1931238 RepID=UPI003BB0DFA1